MRNCVRHVATQWCAIEGSLCVAPLLLSDTFQRNSSGHFGCWSSLLTVRVVRVVRVLRVLRVVRVVRVQAR